MPLHVLSTTVLIIRRSKLYYTVSGIITLKQASGLTSEWSKITKIQFCKYGHPKNSYINFTTVCSYLYNCILVILDHSFQCDDTRCCIIQF